MSSGPQNQPAELPVGIVKVTVNTVFQRILDDHLLLILHDFFGPDVARSGADSRFTQLP